MDITRVCDIVREGFPNDEVARFVTDGRTAVIMVASATKRAAKPKKVPDDLSHAEVLTRTMVLHDDIQQAIEDSRG